jgi:type VI secretion system protein ImpK
VVLGSGDSLPKRPVSPAAGGGIRREQGAPPLTPAAPRAREAPAPKQGGYRPLPKSGGAHPVLDAFGPQDGGGADGFMPETAEGFPAEEFAAPDAGFAAPEFDAAPQARPGPARGRAQPRLELAPDFESDIVLPAMTVRNPLAWLASRVLVRLSGMRSGALAVPAADFHAEATDAIGLYRDTLSEIGYDAETLDHALYAVAATVDDVMQNIPAGAGYHWAQRSMVVHFFGENIGGDRFWETVDELLRRPSGREELIELYHACIGAGFLGRYRIERTSRDGGIQARMSALGAALAATMPRTGDPLTPNWRGTPVKPSRVGILTPLLLAFAAALALALGAYVWLFILTGSEREAAIGNLQGLHDRDTSIVLVRAEPVRSIPPPPPPVEQNTRYQRIKKELAPELASGALEVDARGDGTIRIRANSTQGSLFRPGSDVVSDAWRDFFKRAAEALNDPADNRYAIRIVGHTDSTPLQPGGRFTGNQDLSEKRAISAAAELNKYLAVNERITTSGVADSEPLPDRETENKDRSRRIEIFVPLEGDDFRR